VLRVPIYACFYAPQHQALTGHAADRWLHWRLRTASQPQQHRHGRLPSSFVVMSNLNYDLATTQAYHATSDFAVPILPLIASFAPQWRIGYLSDSLPPLEPATPPAAVAEPPSPVPSTQPLSPSPLPRSPPSADPVASSQDSLFASLPALEPDSQPEPSAASPSTPPPPPLSPQPNQLAHVSHWPSLSLSLSSAAGEEFVRAELALVVDDEPAESDEEVVSHISISISSESDNEIERKRQADVRQSPHIQSLLVLHYRDAETAVRNDINQLRTEAVDYVRHLGEAITRLEHLHERSTALCALIGPAAIRQIIVPAAQHIEEERKHVEPAAPILFPASAQALASAPIAALDSATSSSPPSASATSSSSAASASSVPAAPPVALDHFAGDNDHKQDNSDDDCHSDDDDDSMTIVPSCYTVGTAWFDQPEGLHKAVIKSGENWWHAMPLHKGLNRELSFNDCRKKWKVMSDEVFAKYHIRIPRSAIKCHAVRKQTHSTAQTSWALLRHTLRLRWETVADTVLLRVCVWSIELH